MILEQIRKFLKVGEYYIEEARKFTPEQKMRIEDSLEQYRNGYFLTNEEAEKDILEWSQTNKWKKLEIIEATENSVEFKAYYTSSNNLSYVHHEKSTFIIEDGKWCYVDGEFY